MNQYSFEIIILQINEKLVLFTRNCVICITYLIKYNDKVVKKHLDQLRPNHLNSNSHHDPSDIVSEIPFDNESLRKLINHPVSQNPARSPVILRRNARTTKGKPPRHYCYDYSDSEDDE